MKITGRLRCAGCDRNLMKNAMAAFGMDDEVFNCPSCGQMHRIDVEREEEGVISVDIEKMPSFRITGMAVLANPKLDQKGFTIVPVYVGMPERLQLGTSLFDNHGDYITFAESAYEGVIESKFSTMYGLGHIPRMLAVFPEEFYYQLGHANTMRFIDIVVDSTGFLLKWIKLALKPSFNKKKQEMSAGCLVALSLLSVSPMFANLIDSVLGDNYAIGFENGEFAGITTATQSIRLKSLKPVGETPLSIAQAIVKDHRQYLSDLRTELTKMNKRT